MGLQALNGTLLLHRRWLLVLAGHRYEFFPWRQKLFRFPFRLPNLFSSLLMRQNCSQGHHYQRCFGAAPKELIIWNACMTNTETRIAIAHSATRIQSVPLQLLNSCCADHRGSSLCVLMRENGELERLSHLIVYSRPFKANSCQWKVCSSGCWNYEGRQNRAENCRQLNDSKFCSAPVQRP
jgi:hypothetical protein